MKLNLKNVFLSVGIFAFTLALVGAFSTNKAYANTCTAAVSGDWHTTINWGGCGGVLPQSTDDVVIPGNKIMTLSGNASALSISVSNPVATGNNGISNFNGHTLTVGAGGVTFVGSSGASNSTIAVGSGTLTTTGNIAISGGAVGNSILSVAASGTINVATIVMTDTAADAQLTSTGASNINISGDITGGTFDGTGSTVTFTGAGSHNPGNYATSYHNVAITGGGTVTLAAGQTTTLSGTLTITSGTLATVDNALTVTGASDIFGTISFTTGAKVFTGDVTLETGSVWNETGASTYTISGNFTNNATTFTSSTGLHTFNGGAAKIFSGSATTGSATTPITLTTSGYTNNGKISASTLTVTGVTLTNNGTITAATVLAGTGTLTQGAAGILNLGGITTPVTIAHMNASTNAGNTVNYTGAAQTIFDTDTGTAHKYSNLGLSGSGIKTATAQPLVVGQTLTITAGTLSLAVANTNTANKLYFGATQQTSGTWGAATGSAATHKSNTYFTSGADGIITVAVGGTSTVGPTITTPAPGSTTTTTSVTPVTCTAPQVLDTPTNTCVTPGVSVVCPQGNMFDTATGKKCTDFTPPGLAVAEAAGGNAYAFGVTLIKLGSRGEACKAWQTFFNDKAGAHLVVDGKCGKLTISVAKAWQKSMGLVADGLLGAKSRAKALTQ